MKRAGFTVIELILAVVIVGILALFAMPWFVDFTESAESSTVESIQGSMEVNIGILHIKYILTDETYDAEDVIEDLNTGGADLAIEDL